MCSKSAGLDFFFFYQDFCHDFCHPMMPYCYQGWYLLSRAQRWLPQKAQCLCRLCPVPCMDSGCSRSRQGDGVSVKSLSFLHQSWNLTVSGVPVQGAKPAGNYFYFVSCPLLAGLTPCSASLPTGASTNASASEGSRTLCLGVAWEERILAARQDGPGTHTSKTYRTDHKKSFF